jgi:hypothetical protein
MAALFEIRRPTCTSNTGKEFELASIGALLAIAALLLIPLVPAAVLYKALTPKRPTDATGKATPEEGEAQGGWSADGRMFGKANLTFKVVGSTATYVVLLAVSIFTYLFLMNEADKDAQRIADSLKDNQAWTVRVPIRLRDASGNVLPVDGGTLPQVRVETQPALIQASASDVTFRVILSDGKFPTARFQLPALDPVVLDLNDSEKVRFDYPSRQIIGTQPVWIVLRNAYGATNGSQLATYPDPADEARPPSPTTSPVSQGNAQ